GAAGCIGAAGRAGRATTRSRHPSPPYERNLLMGKQMSDELNAQLAENIKAQPISGVEAAVQELRDAGLNTEADELAVVLEERKRQLDEARAAKAAEEAAAKAKAAAKARAEYDVSTAEYRDGREGAGEQ